MIAATSGCERRTARAACSSGSREAVPARGAHAATTATVSAPVSAPEPEHAAGGDEQREGVVGARSAEGDRSGGGGGIVAKGARKATAAVAHDGGTDAEGTDPEADTDSRGNEGDGSAGDAHGGGTGGGAVSGGGAGGGDSGIDGAVGGGGSDPAPGHRPATGTDSDSAPDTPCGRVGAAAGEALTARGSALKVAQRLSRRAGGSATDTATATAAAPDSETLSVTVSTTTTSGDAASSSTAEGA